MTTLWDQVVASEAAIRTPLSLQASFEEWLASEDGQSVEREIVERAYRLKVRGFRHFGIAALWEAIRYDAAVRVGPDADGWKVNNNWRSRMARHVMANYPDLAGFFETRELTA